MRRLAFAALVLLPMAASLPGCSGGGSPSSSASPSRDSRRLTTEEIDDALGQNVISLYQLIATRKSTWLRQTTSRSPSPGSSTVPAREVAVWMDGVRLGGPEQLRTIPLTVVVEARYLTPSEAQAQLGLNNLGGAIVITTRR